ncbi:MAG: BamA/TamA family outer membrane protein [Paucibacter sp.]|nr:BamA/TamA family outer membrane protein [Roseateles sp.]
MGKQSNRQLHKLAAYVCCCLLTASLHGIAHSQALAPVPLPSFAELEAAGATIGEIRVLAQDIFDTADPHEDKLLFRWANALHMQTRPDVIRRSLLFKPGEPVSLRLIEETERLLRSKRYLYDVELRPAAVHDGVVDIEVLTRDTWSLDPGFSLGRSGGSNSGGIRLHEYNLLGTGTAISLGHSRTVDRSSNELQFFGEHLLGGWTSVALSLASNSDGRRQAVSIARPFYALDTRWAAGVSASKDERIDAFYNAGEISSQYRHQQDLAEVFAGWSDGLQQAWVQRFVLGLNLRDDRYAQAEGLTAPAPALFPRDEKLVTPFVRYSLIEDRFDRVLNRNLIGRPEYFALGLVSSVQLGYASTGLGSSLQGLVYAASVSRGFEPAARQTLIASATLSGQYVDGRVRRQQLGAQVQYYLQQSPRWLFYAAATGALQTNPEPVDALLLGGDNGLRGYPLRYQSGSRSALFTVEERFYTDLYIWRLFRLGGAAFVDVGRAWGGVNTNSVNPGWLADIGFGARIVSARAAFSNVLHLDLAFPLNATADIKKVQFLVKTKTSF